MISLKIDNSKNVSIFNIKQVRTSFKDDHFSKNASTASNLEPKTIYDFNDKNNLLIQKLVNRNNKYKNKNELL